MISHVAMFYPNALDNKDVWLQIARLADLVLVDYNKWDTAAKRALRMSDVFAEIQTKPEFKTINASHLLKSMPRIITRIVYSRIFSQHWKHWV